MRPMSSPPKRSALAFIFVTIFLDATGLGIIIPVTPELIMELTGEGVSAASIYGGWLIFVYAFMQFCLAPTVGNLSDRFGRRPVLLASLAAFSVDYLLMGFAPTIAWLFAGRVVAGITGASFGTANAYIADVSEEGERAKNFGLVGAAWGLGFIAGPVIGGFLGEYGPRVPFFVASGLAAANFVYGFLVVPETLSPERRRPFSLARANPIGAALQMRKHPVVLGLGVSLLLYQVAHDVNPSVWSYYTIEKFGWSERDIGYSLGFVGITIAIVQGGLIRLVINRIGERRAVYVGLVITALGFFGFAFAKTGWMMYAAIIPFSMGGFAIPALRGIMSNQVPQDAQGELQGAITSLVSMTAVMTPPMMTHIFGHFTGPSAPFYFPGAPFFTAAVLVSLSVLWFGRLARSGELVRAS